MATPEAGFYRLDRLPADLVDAVVAHVWEGLVNKSPSLASSPDLAARISKLDCDLRLWMRREYGPGRVYIKRNPLMDKKRMLSEALKGGATIVEAFEAAGVSRRHGYRLLAMKD